MRSLGLLMLFAVGCGASTPVPRYANISDKQYVESKPLPDRPDAIAIPEDQNWAKPLMAGQCTEADGIILSPEKAARAKLWQEGYNGLRGLYETDRQIWQNHRIVYEERTSQANAEIKRLSPSWWAENSSQILWVGGFLMGAATSIAIVYGLEHVK